MTPCDWIQPKAGCAGPSPPYADDRDAFLASQGLRVLRFDVLQVLEEIEGMMKVIFQAISGRWREIPPNPPFRKGGDWSVAPLPRMIITTRVTYNRQVGAEAFKEG